MDTRIELEEEVYSPIYRKDIRSRISLAMFFDKTLRDPYANNIAEWIMRYARTTILHAFLFLFHECYEIFESESADIEKVFNIMEIMVETSSLYHCCTLIPRHFVPGKASHWNAPNRPVYRKLSGNDFEIIHPGNITIPEF